MQLIIFTGFFSGLITVLGGADHLVAMIPSSITSPRSALRNGFSWSLGHSSGVIILTIFTFFVKDISKLARFSHFAEFLVGFSLLFIGFIAIKNSLSLKIHSHSHQHNDGIFHQHFHLHRDKGKKHNKHSHALTSLGLIHGIAGGSHILAILPLIALPFADSIAYLSSYLIGSIFAMNLFTYIISLTTLNIGPIFLKRFIAFAGGLSFSMGLFWIQRSSSYL